MSREAVIIGAGPAGLTAAFELLERTSIKPIIFDREEDIGGISKTVTIRKISLISVDTGLFPNHQG